MSGYFDERAYRLLCFGSIARFNREFGGKEVILDRAMLFAAPMDYANLNNAHLNGANLEEAHLNSAQLKGAHMKDVEISEDTVLLNLMGLEYAEDVPEDFKRQAKSQQKFYNANIEKLPHIGSEEFIEEFRKEWKKI